MQATLKINNANIITPYRIIRGGTVLVGDGKILEVVAGDILTGDNVTVMDARGAYVSPGFVDLHVHGGGGYDFMDGEVDAFLAIAKQHLEHGTTAMTPTTLSSNKESIIQAVKNYKKALAANHTGVSFLGLHLEGPYFALNQRGAQDPRFIRSADPAEYKEVIAIGGKDIARWSAAPELPGALDFGRYLKSHGIMAAAAHTDALYEDMLEAVEAGYSHVTHLYSAMSGVTRRNAFRYAGVIESAFLMDELTVEIIADGVHLPPALLKLVYKIKGADKTALITDAMRAAGMPPGPSMLGSLKDGLEVIVEDGVAKLPDRTSFAGSVALADRLVRTMIQQADVPLTDAIKMMTITPAIIGGVADRKGSLTAGKDADIICFDEHININTVIAGGKVVINRKK